MQADTKKARAVATPFLAELRDAVGLRTFRVPVQAATVEKKKKTKGARFVSSRNADGTFQFFLRDAAGVELAQSISFADGKAAGQVSQQLATQTSPDLRDSDMGLAWYLDGQQVATVSVTADRIHAVLTEMHAEST